MKYMDVFHTKCMEQFAQAPPARRASIMEDTSESQAVNRLPKSQYVAGFVVFDGLSQDDNPHTKTTFLTADSLGRS
jgi:hypothetical protein